MKLEGTIDIEAPAQAVWQLIIDPIRLSACVPGVSDVRQARAVRVLAVHETGLLRMEFEPAFRHPSGDGVLDNLACRSVVQWTTTSSQQRSKRTLGEDPCHPGIERIVQEQVGWQRRDCRTLRGSAITPFHPSVRVHERRLEPPAHVEQDPGQVGAGRDSLERELMVDAVEVSHDTLPISRGSRPRSSSSGRATRSPVRHSRS